MIFCADTFPVRQPYLSLSPNIKISPSSNSPNFPFSHIGSPKTVSLVSTEVPTGSQALGFPPVGSRLGGRGTNRALAGRARCPAALHTPRDGAAGGVVSSRSLFHHCLTQSLSLLLKGSHCQCAEDAAASSFYSSRFTNLPLFQQKPQGPHAAQIPIHLVHG